MIELTTTRLLIRTPMAGDEKRLVNFESKNKKHWIHFNNTLEDELCIESYFEYILKEYAIESANNQSVRFLIFERENLEKIIESCNFTQIFRGAFQAAYLGYKIDFEYEGKGLMFEALEKAISYMFEVKNLHRIMANYIPENKRSESLLLRLKFEKEGYAKNYLLINGKWQDHVLTALTHPHWKHP